MRALTLVGFAAICGWTAGGILLAADRAAPSAPEWLTPVKVQSIAAKDLPVPEPVPEWNAKWKSYLAGANAFACVDKWVYVMSSANGYYLTFERDLATPKLQFRGALEMHRHTEKSWGGLDVRRLADGAPILYANYGTEQNPYEISLRWFRVDPKSGGLKEAGALPKGWPFPRMPGPYGYAAQIWNPDRSRLYRAFVENITWLTFKEDGTPEAGGSVKMQNRSDGGGRPHPHAIFSRDGKQLYLLVQRAKAVGGVTWLLDQYDVDAKTGVPAYVSSLDMPGGEGWNQFLDFTPDGRFTYVLVGDSRAQLVLILKRDPAQGRLSIAGQMEDAKFQGLGGAPWERGKFCFNADGRSGYFMARPFRSSFQLFPFTRDAASGALSIYAPVRGNGYALELDAVHGCLLWGSNPINVFQTPAAKGK